MEALAEEYKIIKKMFASGMITLLKPHMKACSSSIQRIPFGYPVVSFQVKVTRSICLVKTRITIRMMYYSVSDTGIIGKKSECSHQESNIRPSDY